MSNSSKLDASVNLTMEDDFFVGTYQQSKELDSIVLKVIFVIVAFVSVLASATAIIAMHRSKKTPYASKVLSTGLLTFDVIFITTSTIRKFISEPIVNLNMQTVVIWSLQLSVFTVGLMSLERYFAIVKPMLYITHIRKRFIWKTFLFAWVLEGSLCLVFRYGACYAQYQSMSVFTTVGFCNALLSMFYAAILVFVVTTSCICYWKIFACIRSKIRPCNIPNGRATLGHIKINRSTSLVLVYLIVIIVSSVGYGIILLLVSFGNVNFSCLRIALEFVSFSNCLFDPFLYVIWFKECRFQLFKILAFFCSQYEQSVEQMRIRVYDIVISNEIRRKDTSE